MTDLRTAPSWLIELWHEHEARHEGAVGFYAVTAPVPDDPARVVVDSWVIVTTRGLYYFGADDHEYARLNYRAKSIHPLPTHEDEDGTS